MSKSGFAEIGEYNPRKECTFKKHVDENGETLSEHIGEDGTPECSLEARYGAIDPFASMGYFTTVCRNHMEVPKRLMTRMAELYRSFPESREGLTDEKSRVNKEVERQRIEDPDVENQKRLKKQWDEQHFENKDNISGRGILDFDLSQLFE